MVDPCGFFIWGEGNDYLAAASNDKCLAPRINENNDQVIVGLMKRRTGIVLSCSVSEVVGLASYNFNNCDRVRKAYCDVGRDDRVGKFKYFF